jgi:hypothetical protein
VQNLHGGMDLPICTHCEEKALSKIPRSERTSQNSTIYDIPVVSNHRKSRFDWGRRRADSSLVCVLLVPFDHRPWRLKQAMM